ncbi:hypothetical protein HNR72_007226 [Streptomyces collinus]|uniref:Uncharacterized protein n=1 Tax=Streptomyces collinus TaxID=42684 RepID=A0AA89Q9I9_STRCU|nr:hypothetical protein [Streptomyces collinus]
MGCGGLCHGEVREPPTPSAVHLCGVTAAATVGPCEVVNGEKRFAGHGRGGRPGERLEVPVQVGLVGVAAVRCDFGRAFTRDQAVGGMVEADQLHGVWAAGRAATGTGATAAYGSIRPRQRVRRPGSGPGLRRSGAMPRPHPGPPAGPPHAGGRAARPSMRSAPAREISPSRSRIPDASRPHRSPSDTTAPSRPRWGRCRESRVRSRGTGVPARTRRSLPEPGPQGRIRARARRRCFPLLLSRATVEDGRARAELQEQCHSRVRDHPKGVQLTDTEPGHRQTGHPAGPLRACHVQTTAPCSNVCTLPCYESRPREHSSNPPTGGRRRQWAHDCF